VIDRLVRSPALDLPLVLSARRGAAGRSHELSARWADGRWGDAPRRPAAGPARHEGV